jgi:hypothetical protein
MFVLMKAKTKKKIGVSLLLIGILITYSIYNFKEQKQQLSELIAPSSFENVKQTLANLDSVKGFSNPIVHLVYKYRFKRRYHNRFIKNEKESISDNPILNEISNIYKEYWKIKMLRKPNFSIADSLLKRNLYSYFKSEKLTQLPFEEYTISELNRIIEEQGATAQFFYLNEKFSIIIWDKQTVNNYQIELPNDTINIEVTNIENYLLEGAQHYATVGESSNGGWVNEHTFKVYCNKGAYDFSSEKFLISYLKHEGYHFVDLKKYKNLSAADLEYRAKLVEFIYLENDLYARIEEFILYSNSNNRGLSHPYANYTLIRDLSKKIFDTNFEKNIDVWKKVSKEKIHQASLELLEESNAILNQNPDLEKVID